MLTLTPVVCVCGGIVVSEILSTYLNLARPNPPDSNESRQRKKSPSEKEITATPGTYGISTPSITLTWVGIFHIASKTVVVISFAVYLSLFVRHSTYVTSTAYSSPSVVLASRMADGSQYIIDDYREAYYWLRMNTPNDARVMSWYLPPQPLSLFLDVGVDGVGGIMVIKSLGWQIVRRWWITTLGITHILLPWGKQCLRARKSLIRFF
jgi:asparagine N-glycosylation enzyme membrane subunit Stt3